MANGLRNNSIPPYRKSCASSAQDFFIFPINSEEFLRELKELKELSLPSVAEELRQQSFWRSF